MYKTCFIHVNLLGLLPKTIWQFILFLVRFKATLIMILKAIEIN